MENKFWKISLILVVAFQLTTQVTYPYTCTTADKASTVCTMEYLGVCGLYDPTKVQCIKAPCGITSSTACTACQIANVQTVILGECDKQSSTTGGTSTTTNGMPSGTAYPCKQEDRGVTCTQQYGQGCAFYDNTVTCDQKPCMKTIPNTCDGCSDPKVEKLTGGKCVAESTNIKESAGNASFLNYALILCFVTLLF
jgi:hypothetical protein